MIVTCTLPVAVIFIVITPTVKLKENSLSVNIVSLALSPSTTVVEFGSKNTLTTVQGRKRHMNSMQYIHNTLYTVKPL